MKDARRETKNVRSRTITKYLNYKYSVSFKNQTALFIECAYVKHKTSYKM